MRLVWHIIWKDVRRLRWPLALWGAVILVQYAVWHGQRPHDEAGGLRRVTDMVLLLWGLHLVLGWLLVPQVMADDPLLEERAAWRTRPISGGRLLAAKLGGIFVMVCVWPSLLTVPWWIEFGFGPGEIVRAVAVNVVGMMLFAGLALMVAVLTGRLARFIAWSLVFVVAAVLGGLVLAVRMPESGERELSAAVVLTRASLACWLTVATAAIVVPLQFLTRRTKLARGVAIAMAFIIAAVVQVWPWTAAEVSAKLGWTSLPTVTARITDGTLVVPSGEKEQSTWARVTTEFELKGMAGGDLPMWREADPTWRIGERRLGVAHPLRMEGSSTMQTVAANLARGQAVGRDLKDRASWDMSLSNRIGPQVRTGGAVLGARYAGSVWRGELGPSVALRVGAWAGRGLEQVHVHQFTPEKNYGDRWERGSVVWWQTGPLFDPAVMLEMVHPDGVRRNRFRAAVLFNDKQAILDERPRGDHRTRGPDFLRGRTPVGLVSVVPFTSEFDRRWGGNWDVNTGDVLKDGASLASVTFQVAAPLRVALVETPFVPDFVIEGRLDEALRRAKAEDKRVLARVQEKDNDNVMGMPGWWNAPQVRDLLVANFVCVQVTGEEAARLRKKTDEAGVVFLAVLKPNGEEQDRLRDLGGDDLRAALRANLDGKTYAAVLMDALAAKGGDDRNLRFQVHAALRARGELAGAFDAILWMVDHASDAPEGTEIFQVGWRLQRFVASYGPAKAALLERREQAVAALRQDVRDVSAARRLFVITLGLRHDDAIWREFPRLLPHDNPSWWEYLRYWMSLTVSQKRYREVTERMEVEKFFAEGPAWVRAQLMARRSLTTDGTPAGIADWQQQLLRTGEKCVEALAGAGQDEAALRVASAVMRIHGAKATREMLANAMARAGAKAELVRKLTTEASLYGR